MSPRGETRTTDPASSVRPTTGQVVNLEDGSPVQGIWVTDGCAWAKTDHGGRFALAAREPTVWLRQTDQWASTQWWKSAGGEVTFSLQARRPASGTTFAHLSDVHVSAPLPATNSEVELAARYGDGTDRERGLERALASAARAGADFAVITGDLTDHGTIEELRRFAALAASAPLDVYMVPGNHDHYGHRYEPDPADRPAGNGFLGDATTRRYPKALGPRWWSADRDGLHIIGLDWFSARCGIDDDKQRDFLTADLERTPVVRPVLVLTHDQLDQGALDQLSAGHRTVVAVLSGHWHAPKVVDDRGVLEISTGPVTFGGLDWSPPQFRLCHWDGAHLSPEPPQPLLPQRRDRAQHLFQARARQLGSAQHGAQIVTHGDRFIVPAQTSETSSVVTCISATGTVLWQRPVTTGRVSGLAATPATVFATTVAGAVHALNPEDGTVLWAYRLPEPAQRRVAAPATIDPERGLVIVGDVGAVAALEARNGHLRWLRTDLGPSDTLLTYGAGISTSRAVVLPFGGPHRGLTALDPRSGETVWSDPPGTPPPSSPVIPLGSDAVVIRDRMIVTCFDPDTGSLRWQSELPPGFTTAAPHDGGNILVVTTGNGLVVRLDPRTGSTIDQTQLSCLHPSYGPYRTTGPSAPTGPLTINGHTYQTLLDGTVWALGAAGPQLLADLAQPVTTQPACLGSLLATINSLGQFHLIETANSY